MAADTPGMPKLPDTKPPDTVSNVRGLEGKNWTLTLSAGCLKQGREHVERAAATRIVARVEDIEGGVLLERHTSCKYNSMVSWVTVALAGVKNVSKGDWCLAVSPDSFVSTQASSQHPGSDAAAVKTAAARDPSPTVGPVVALAALAASPLDPTWFTMKALAQEGGAAPSADHSLMQLGVVAGEGVFGKVTRAVHTVHGDVVVKQLKKKETFNDFLREVLFAERLRGHPHLVHIVDIFVAPGSVYQIIFRDAGMSLAQWYKSESWDRAAIPHIMEQLCGALSHCHLNFVAHTDVKTPNICINDAKEIRLCDFGNAVYCVPGHRRLQPPSEVRKKGLHYGSLWWRAPAVLLGDVSFNTPCDLWSAGCIVAELVGKAALFQGDSAVGMLMLILRFLGTPAGAAKDYVMTLPAWSPHFPSFQQQQSAWDAVGLLYKSEKLFFDGTLALVPDARLTAGEAATLFAVHGDDKIETAEPAPLASSDQIDTEEAGQTGTPQSGGDAMKMQLHIDGGRSEWQGGRGLYSLVSGRGDPWFANGGADLPVNFEDVGSYGVAGAKRRRYESDCKLEIAGHLTPGEPVTRSKLTANAVDASEPMFERARAFNAAFKAKNRDLLWQMQLNYRRSLKKMSKEGRGANGEDLLNFDVLDWCWDLATLQFMQGEGEGRQDPLHWDGGASVLAYILTLWGRRTCTFSNVDGSKTTMWSKPGTVYTGGFCQAEHFVTHPATQLSEEMCESASGPCEVALCVRSRMFRHNRASGGRPGPTPKIVAEAVLEAVRKTVTACPFTLPTLPECEAAGHLTAPEASTPPLPKEAAGLRGHNRGQIRGCVFQTRGRRHCPTTVH